jgi:hypothetical protein
MDVALKKKWTDQNKINIEIIEEIKNNSRNAKIQPKRR